MGFGVPLPPAYLPRVHSQEPRLPSGRRCHTPAHVPPSWFHTTTTVSSTRELRVCCTPQPTKGSSRFLHAATTPPGGGRATGQSPRRGSHPSKTFPHQQPYPHHHGPLPSCRYRPARPDLRLAPTILPTTPPPRWRCVHPRWPCSRAPGRPAPRGAVSGGPIRWFRSEDRRGAPKSAGACPEGRRSTALIRSLHSEERCCGSENACGPKPVARHATDAPKSSGRRAKWNQVARPPKRREALSRRTERSKLKKQRRFALSGRLGRALSSGVTGVRGRDSDSMMLRSA
jgi:hypothetical protein